MAVLRRVASVVLCLSLSAGNAAVCAGWAPTPEARMACCANEAGCPMHEEHSHGTPSGQGLTQAQADDCCAVSERQSSPRPTLTFVATISSAVLGSGIALPESVPALMLTDRWRTVTPIPTASVSRHVLLSVFLV